MSNIEPLEEKKYWHVSSADSCTIHFDTYSSVKEGIIDGNEYGPFDTLGECKKDAIAYHQCTINYARIAMHDIKNTKARDLK